jgi:hypothetical protein
VLRNANPKVADPDAYLLFEFFGLDPDLYVEYGSEC